MSGLRAGLGWSRGPTGLQNRGKSAYCHGSSQDALDLLGHRKPTDRPCPSSGGRASWRLISLSHCFFPAHTVIVRKFFLILDLHPFCFRASFLLLGGNVL